MENKETTNTDQEVITPTSTISMEEVVVSISTDVAQDAISHTTVDSTLDVATPRATDSNQDGASQLDSAQDDASIDASSIQDEVDAVAEIVASTPARATQEIGRSGKPAVSTLEVPIVKSVTSTRVVTADSVEAEEVPTIPLGPLQELSTLRPEVSVHSVASTQSLRIPAPLVVQPSEYRRSLGEWVQVWWEGLRPGYLPFSLMPLLLGSVLAWTQSISAQKIFGYFHFTHFIGSIIAIVLLQLGANLVNDYYDYLRGVDTANTLGPGGLIQQGLVKPTSILTLGFALLGVGTLIGIVIALAGGPLVYLFGLLGLIVVYFYSATSRSLSALGLGEFVGFCIFGPLITLGAYMVQTGGNFTLSALIYSLAPGLLAAAAIHLNNIRDLEGDEHAGRRTLALRMGLRWSRGWALVLFIAAYAIIILLGVPHGAPHFVLLSLWTLPTLAVILTGVLRTDTHAGFHLAMRQTIKLLIFFTLLLIIGLIISALIPVMPRIPLHLLGK
ncbi:MAG TPA: UbiA family prenyltransferase [Ktedonobacteraceae bacterium]|nr:UbiA family prenyltransferase [Ktedonobacteraceae bacterium]